MIIALIILASIIVLFVLIILLTELITKKIFFKRGDGALSIKYQNLPEGISYQNLSFKCKKETLRGRLYFDENIDKYKAVIILSHGIGFGHLYLMPLIEYLAKNEYIVMAYDMTGSGFSSGKRIKCMTQAVVDIESAIKFVLNNKNLHKYPLYLLGHSWGGFASLAALNYDYPIKKVVSISGFNHEANLAYPILRPLLRLHNFFHYGKRAYYSAKRGLKRTDAKVLYIQGANDKVVPLNAGSNIFKKIKNPNLKVEVLKNKYHSPFIKEEDELKAMTLLANLGMFGEKYPSLSFNVNYKDISHPDDKVYKMILDFLDN